MDLFIASLMIGTALYLGLSEIAKAIRCRNININWTAPITLKHIVTDNIDEEG